MPPSDVAERRRKILDAASRMFFSVGFTETTLEAIGREAGVPKRTIYELIGDKSVLFQEACNNLRIQGPTFQFDIKLTGRTLPDILTDMARKLVTHSLRRDLIALERAVMIESTRNPEMVAEVVEKAKVGFINTLGGIFAEMIRLGLIKPVDIARAADIFYDLAVGARGFRAALGHPEGVPSDDEIEERMNIFRFGFLERSPSR